MSINNPKPNEKFVPSYQISGKPFVKTVTGSVAAGGTEITFPNVTRWVQVTNLGTTGQDVYVGFSANGVNGPTNTPATSHFYQLQPAADGAGNQTTGRLEMRCKSVFVKAVAGAPVITVAAGLTDISDLRIALTGSEGVS